MIRTIHDNNDNNHDCIRFSGAKSYSTSTEQQCNNYCNNNNDNLYRYATWRMRLPFRIGLYNLGVVAVKKISLHRCDIGLYPFVVCSRLAAAVELRTTCPTNTDIDNNVCIH